MKKNEINELVENSFKKIDRYFHKSITSFETGYIHEFRTEIKKLKVFFHLLSMESADGLSYRITKRMKTVYGYLGIIQNFKLQLKKVNKNIKKSVDSVPVCYVTMLEKELAYWKKICRDFVDPDYDFVNDEKEIINVLPDKLTKKSIRKFIHYTVYELNTISGRIDDEALDNARKFMEDIYYNYEFIRPFIIQQQTNLFNKKTIGECLKLFDDFRDKCVAIALLQTFDAIKLDEPEKQLLKEIENDWLHEKKELKNQLSVKLDSMHIKAYDLNGPAFTNSLNEAP